MKNTLGGEYVYQGISEKRICCQASIQYLPNWPSILKMPSPCETRANETHIHESTLINYFPKLLHLIMVPKSPTQFFTLFSHLIKIPYTYPRDLRMIDEAAEIIPCFPSFCHFWFTIKPCKTQSILSVFINIRINIILWWPLHCEVDWCFPKQNQSASPVIARHHPFIFKLNFLLYSI